jgi:HSP20 family protein
MLLQELSRSRLFDTLREMEKLHGRFNQLLEGPWRTPPEFPPLNAWINEESAVVTAEIPGVEANDIDISVVNDTLTLRGSRTADEVGASNSRHRQERGFGQFSRTIQLPFRIDTDRVVASNKNGILYVTLPRAEQDKPRKIAVRMG